MNLSKRVKKYLKIIWDFIKELPAASGGVMRG